VAISDTATHRPKHARGAKIPILIHTNTQWQTNTIAYRNTNTLSSESYRNYLLSLSGA